MAINNTGLQATCIASTGDDFCKTVRECDEVCRGARRNHGHDDGSQSNFFKEAQFSPDGTSIITNTEDNCLRTYVLPTDLLDEEKRPHSLSAYATGSAPGNIHAFATYPGFDLRDPSTTCVLYSVKEQPISLVNALDDDSVYGTYNSINPTTEAYQPSNSLAFTRDGSHFVAGSVSLISIFDCSRVGSEPVTKHRTSRSRKTRAYHSATTMGCKGLISALSVSSDGILAAGSTEREVALYDHEGQGECTTAFSVSQRLDGSKVNGTGISNLRWSPCNRYLLVAERQADCVQVYDVRHTLRQISILTGREANTTQKLGIDVVPTAEGYEVWAGGADGSVGMWSNPGHAGDEQAPDAQMKLHDGWSKT